MKIATCNICTGMQAFEVAWDNMGSAMMESHFIKNHNAMHMMRNITLVEGSAKNFSDAEVLRSIVRDITTSKIKTPMMMGHVFNNICETLERHRFLVEQTEEGPPHYIHYLPGPRAQIEI